MENINVRLLDLSEVEREVLEEYGTSIRKLFLVKGNPSLVNFEEDEFRGDIKQFLESCISIFSKLPKNSFLPGDLNNNREDDQNTGNIFQVDTYSAAEGKCLSKFRSVYRKYFRVVAYLTWDKLQTCHSKAVYEALKKWRQLSSENPIQLEESMKQEGDWIREVNSWKMEKVLEQIKCEVVETIKKELELELPHLYGGKQEFFFEKCEFAEKCGEIRTRAEERFIEEIDPLLRDEPKTRDKVVREFNRKDVKRKLICHLVFRNTLGKFRYYWKLRKCVENAVTEYGERLDSVLYPTSIHAQHVVEMNPNLILKESEMLRQALFPKSILLEERERFEDVETIDMKISYLKKYHKEIQSKFGEVLRNASLIAEANLIRCEIDTEEVLGRMMGELKDIFVEYKLSKEHVDRWQERVEGELLMIIRKSKRFSIANQYHVERLLVGSQRSTEEALEKINADFVIDGFQSPTSSTRLIVSADDDVEMRVNINGRFGNLPLSMLMNSGTTSLMDDGNSLGLSRTFWKLATSLLPSVLKTPTS